ncbi:hypothetical protein DITRI_Ditri07aG0047200 [Diplodiscus trichospermus]
MSKWDELQSRLISQFRNASSIISRLEVIQNSKNYTSLSSIEGIEVAVLQKQIDSLQTILLSMKNTMEEFQRIVLSLEKLQHDGKLLAKGCCNQMNRKELQQRLGVKPSPKNCIDGLLLLHEMHRAEYVLKLSLVSALSALALKPNSNDLGALQQFLVDQPNIPNDEGITCYPCIHHFLLLFPARRDLLILCISVIDNLPFPDFVEVLWRVKPLGFRKLASIMLVPCC